MNINKESKLIYDENKRLLMENKRFNQQLLIIKRHLKISLKQT